MKTKKRIPNVRILLLLSGFINPTQAKRRVKNNIKNSCMPVPMQADSNIVF